MPASVITLCDKSGVMVRPWAEAGYHCYAVDIQHEEKRIEEVGLGRITFLPADIHRCISEWLPWGINVAFAFGFPPCTHTAVSGARHFTSKGPRKAAEAFGLIARVDHLLKMFGCPYGWEQPVAVTSTYCGPPTHVFNPCDYGGYLHPVGDRYTKKTCLWTGNGFVMPHPKPVEPIEGSKMHRLGPSPERANLRSVTPAGFARAVFLANAKT